MRKKRHFNDIIVKNFIPTIEDDQLPAEVRTQFEKLQNVIETQQNDSLLLSSIENNNNSDPRSKNETIRSTLALSLALSVQYEIDGLLNGISELENIVNNEDLIDSTCNTTNIVGDSENVNIINSQQSITMRDNDNKRYKKR